MVTVIPEMNKSFSTFSNTPHNSKLHFQTSDTMQSIKGAINGVLGYVNDTAHPEGSLASSPTNTATSPTSPRASSSSSLTLCANIEFDSSEWKVLAAEESQPSAASAQGGGISQQVCEQPAQNQPDRRVKVEDGIEDDEEEGLPRNSSGIDGPLLRGTSDGGNDTLKEEPVSTIDYRIDSSVPNAIQKPNPSTETRKPVKRADRLTRRPGRPSIKTEPIEKQTGQPTKRQDSPYARPKLPRTYPYSIMGQTLTISSPATGPLRTRGSNITVNSSISGTITDQGSVIVLNSPFYGTIYAQGSKITVNTSQFGTIRAQGCEISINAASTGRILGPQGCKITVCRAAEGTAQIVNPMGCSRDGYEEARITSSTTICLSSGYWRFDNWV
ncbi:hypothetical protein BU16DRAFT_556747 [Lophium mytilinum]|uniref:Uncharacterized protein n=1 Tax=Lophium mytilinum TaxID=390894 RepID=A0A6A6R6S9_9PEZI|nr:hypothetical protein BU16DRAFT_556747 [Lophium mytilinum]